MFFFYIFRFNSVILKLNDLFLINDKQFKSGLKKKQFSRIPALRPRELKNFLLAHTRRFKETTPFSAFIYMETQPTHIILYIHLHGDPESLHHCLHSRAWKPRESTSLSFHTVQSDVVLVGRTCIVVAPVLFTCRVQSNRQQVQSA